MNPQSPTEPAFTSLALWLTYLDTLHSKTIDLGLERVAAVFQNMAIAYSGTVITVAGTNGKGSTCATLEHFALALGKTVGVFGSPELLDYKERVRVNGEQLSEASFCQAFTVVERARGNISLSPFEFGTLVAMQLLALANPDVVILEVGLGGRLDAVNVIDPDLAVITSIGIDHQAFLGNTREAIALEKAGIMRPGGRAVIGDLDPPDTLKTRVEELEVKAVWAGQDFQFESTSETDQTTWCWQRSGIAEFQCLPEPSVPRQNVATAIACAVQLGWSPSVAIVKQVCLSVALLGRFQVIQTQPRIILDVAHNPQATAYLQNKLQQYVTSKNQLSQLHLVVGMLSDKDSAASLQPFTELSANWYLAPLPTPRSATVLSMADELPKNESYQTFTSVEQALEQAKVNASSEDTILVFGSFYTVAEVLRSKHYQGITKLS